MEGKEWKGVDLDGTLSEVDYSKPYDYRHIGKPIPRMVERIRQWRSEGKLVKILTARAEEERAVPHIHAWLIENLGFDLEVTNSKDYYMTEFWDDRAVQVIPNTGVAVQELSGVMRRIYDVRKLSDHNG
jgi:hypothetical protein